MVVGTAGHAVDGEHPPHHPLHPLRVGVDLVHVFPQDPAGDVLGWSGAMGLMRIRRVT